MDGKMELGATTETVEVTNATPLLQADSSSVSTLVTENAVQNIPLNGRNFINLVQVQPGVNSATPSGLGSGTRADDRRLSSTYSANGQSDLQNNALIDGMDNNERVTGSPAVRPSIDASVIAPGRSAHSHRTTGESRIT